MEKGNYPMNHNEAIATPTISMQSVQHEDGSWGVNLYVTGLQSEKHADAALDHMARLFCGAEIKTQG